jgi:hypothetical protein
MSTSSAPVVFGPSPLSHADKKIISFNKKQVVNHQKILNEYKKMSRRYNVNQFLTNLNEDKYNKIVEAFPNFQNVRNRIIYPEEIQDEDETILLKEVFQFDKQVNNKKSLNLELIKFIIYLIYDDINISNTQLNNIFLVSSNLINHEFRASFKILTKSSKFKNLTSINKFYYFLIAESNNDIIFNEDIIMEEEEEKDENLYNCCCCLENFKKQDKYIRCLCSIDICVSCFPNVSNKCPLCRRTGYLKEVDIKKEKEGERLIKFTRAGKTHEREINNLKYLTEENELFLIFHDWNTGNVRDSSIVIKDGEDIINNEYDGLEDDLIYRIPYNEILSYIYHDTTNPFYNIIDAEILNFIRENNEATAGEKIKKILRIEDIDDYKKFREYRDFEIERDDFIYKQLYRRDTGNGEEDYFYMIFDDNKFEFERYYNNHLTNQYGEIVDEKIFNIDGTKHHGSHTLNDFTYNNMVGEIEVII